ncbi:LysR family transcriptional regulator, partial [Paenibacillus sepulcri]|nr:LysR family transcriptional regulator [Paenibacillus sepulcri]
MELRQLEYFRALCKELHFSKAAESIGISQPTLSQQIKVLEEEMELPLFDRLGKRIAITEAGQVLYEQCEEIFQRIEYVKDYFSEMRTQERGRLRVGVIPGAVDLLLGQMVADYHSAYPEVSLAILGST